MSGKEIIVRDRIFLDLLSPKDSSELFEYRSLPEVYKFLNWFPKNHSDAERYIFENTINSGDEPGDWKQFGIFLLRNNKLIGDIGYCLLSSLEAEIEYTVSPNYQGEGVATEAAGGLVEHLFEHKMLYKITARTAPENIASIKVLKNLGFEREARLVKNVKVKGRWSDDIVYSLMK